MRGDGERGSASLELALIVPVLMLLLTFVVGLGRMGQARAQIDAAAAQAARAASLARTPAGAAEAARRYLSAPTAGGLPACGHPSVDVDVSAFHPGGRVVVDLTCRVSLDRLTGLGWPGSKLMDSRAVAVVDAYPGHRMKNEEGKVTAFVVGVMLALLVLAGLVIDGGYALAARRRAFDEADGAARAGAQALDVGRYRSRGNFVLEPSLAESAVNDYLAPTGHRGTVRVTGDHISVQVQVEQPMAILRIVGIRDLTVSATGDARLVNAGAVSP